MKIKDNQVAHRLHLLLPGASKTPANGANEFRNSETWRLAARSALFMQLNAIEDAAFETDVVQRQGILTRAVDNIAALVTYLELSCTESIETMKEQVLEYNSPPERRVLQMGRAG
jgi:hypothetical protein